LVKTTGNLRDVRARRTPAISGISMFKTCR
jgi:hypothetical protein